MRDRVSAEERLQCRNVKIFSNMKESRENIANSPGPDRDQNETRGSEISFDSIVGRARFSSILRGNRKIYRKSGPH